MELYYTYY